jgi:hypothetical protein
MSACYFDTQNRFVIEDFDSFPSFASFLPGIAGPLGIPLWAFYVNRGQAMASFGVESKDTPIMEFQPANKAYQTVPYTGFRTFIKVGEAGTDFYEPFSAGSRPAPPRQLLISPNELELHETSVGHGLQVNILYFTLPGESFAALVRQVTLQNISAQPISFELLDGMPIVIPYGVNDTLLKKIGRTAEAWMAVFHTPAGVPVYRVQASVGDEAEVVGIEGGHFYLAFTDATAPNPNRVPVRSQFSDPAMIVDQALVFGPNTALSFPDRFLSHALAELRAQPQVTVCRTPCGFAGLSGTLAPGEAVNLYAVIGHVGDDAIIDDARARLANPAYIAARRAEAQALTQHLGASVATHTADPRFDAYCRQDLLDNILRGGWPSRVNGHLYHLYGRRHGDLERDYNAFYLPAEFFAQGNASYRDVNQNRRCDVLLNPAVGDAEVLAFLGLIQADGYNPLTVYGTRFVVSPDRQAAVLDLVDRPDALRALLGQPFSPGQLLKSASSHGLRLAVAPETFVETAVGQAEPVFAATFGEGYWIDHWFYNLDLLDTYLAVYPDHKDELLFARTVPYYQGPAYVQPRDRKSVEVEAAKVRQYGAVVEDEEVMQLIVSRTTVPNLMRTAHGAGDVFRTTVFGKLVGLALLKFATLDPLGMGIEMEAGKPGWCDALNGLPGLFGSSLAETYQLGRLLDFLLAGMAEKEHGAVALPVELADLLRQVADQLVVYAAAGDEARAFRYWDAVSCARETYRAATRLGFDGRVETLTFTTLAPVLRAFRAKVASGIAQAEALTDGIPPTYFTYEAQAYTTLDGPDGRPLCDARGRPYVRVQRFTQRTLPPFLEGSMHALRTCGDVVRARELYAQVRASALFDRKLGMYKSNAPLDGCPHEIGRLRAFTPGWLENESIFLHMAYKYLLEVLRAGLHDEFFTDLRRGLVPFLDPQVYGRSPLENSSFIVSSAHPDTSLHGRGFVARLTGAAAEFLSMWCLMTAGPQPFFVRNGELGLALRPTLPHWLFREDGTLIFTFLGHCTVTCRAAGAGALHTQVTSITLDLPSGGQCTLPGDVIAAPYAEMVRRGEIRQIELYLA